MVCSLFVYIRVSDGFKAAFERDLKGFWGGGSGGLYGFFRLLYIPTYKTAIYIPLWWGVRRGFGRGLRRGFG